MDRLKFFIAVVHKEPGSAYGVHFPDVPGCFSAADERTDLLSNAVEALQLHFDDGDQIPEPSDIEAIREMATEDISEGAVLLAVPFIQSTARQVRANISMDAGMMQAIDATAEARGLTRSGFIVDAVRNEIEGRH